MGKLAEEMGERRWKVGVEGEVKSKILYLAIIITNSMNRKIVAVWLSLAMLSGFVVIMDVVTDFTPTVKATTLYVNTTGSGGAYTSIQDAINASSDGVTVFVYSGTYYENVMINKTINLTGEKQISTIIEGSGSGEVVTIEVDQVNITGFKITGGSSGIRFNNAHNCSVTKNNASDNLYGIYMYISHGNNIKNNTISNNDYGLYLDSCTWNYITNNNISYNEKGLSSSGMFLYNSSNNIVINNNLSNNARYGSLFTISHGNNISCNEASNNIYGIGISQSNGNSINNNNVSNNIEGISVYESNEIDIIDNSIIRNSMYGIHLSKSIANNLINNTMINNGIRIIGEQIKYWNTHNIEISNIVNGKPVYYLKNQTGGIIPSNAGQVILANCTNIEVKDTELINCSIGILLGFSMKNNITHNNASNNYVGIGISLIYSDENKVSDNTVLNNEHGIAISMSKNNEIKRNKNTNCGYGFFLWSSSNNKLMNNNVSNNDYGMDLYFSINNHIFHNNFINNTKQVQDDGSNSWNNSYPLGGNYWSDYSGVDNFKGPNQDMTGSDGIGDTPYIIDADSQDNYPLMNPYIYKSLENYTILKQGWNLISFPLIQDNQDLTKALEMIDGWYDAVQWHDITDTTDSWKHQKVDKPFGNDLFELIESIGFWIHITNPGDTIFLYNGTPPTSNQTIQLHPGWNLVGYPSNTSYNRTKGLNKLEFGLDVDAVQWYDASTQTWHDMGPDDVFVPRRGYWVHAEVECEWEVPL